MCITCVALKSQKMTRNYKIKFGRRSKVPKSIMWEEIYKNYDWSLSKTVDETKQWLKRSNYREFSLLFSFVYSFILAEGPIFFLLVCQSVELRRWLTQIHTF